MTDDAETTLRPLVNLEEAERTAYPLAPTDGCTQFGARISPLGPRLGAQKLGAMLILVEPGKRAFPYHNHQGNEEMFVILAGTGEITIGGASHAIREGDVISTPAGGPETAHQIVNTGSEMLRYLAISTTEGPDIVEYPKSGERAKLEYKRGRPFMTELLEAIGQVDGRLDGGGH
ncbi:MAG: cupin domain-containing protein [Paracoccaceae bacterium]